MPPTTTTVEAGSQVTRSTALQIPPQPETVPLGRNRHAKHPGALTMDTDERPAVPRGIINPKRGMTDSSLEPQTPRPPRTCSGSPGPARPCWSMDMKVAVVLVTVAGALILLLLYRLLLMRHRLKLARARNALQYYSFYHAAAYTFPDPAGGPQAPTFPAKNNSAVPEAAPTLQAVNAATPIAATTATAPLPSPPMSPPSSLPLPPPPPPPALPPPPLHPPPPLLLLPHPPPTTPSLPLLQLPIIHTTPPSPHLSWGASSDVSDVYSRIGVFRPSRRLSSLSGRTQVILFEHSSL